ncbi:MAG: dihydrolipoamide acetyltransferase family protein [Acidimicrobiales bacterium]
MTDSGTQILTVKVPDVGEGIAEVELVSWAVAEGQTVTRDQIVAEVMTDKATVEVPAPVDGVVQALSGDVGETLLVGSPLFALATDSDGTEPAEPQTAATTAPVAAQAQAQTPNPTAAPVTQPAAAPAPIPSPALRQAAPLPEGRRPTATPAVRRRARDAGIDLRTVRGTGPAARITHEDLDAVFAGAASASSTGHADTRRPRAENSASDDQPIVGMRRKIAEQMVASTSTIPHITYVEEIDMTALEDLRKTLNDQALDQQADPADGSPKLTLLPFLIRALVNQLPQFPSMNAHVLESASGESAGGPDVLRSIGGVHVGIATQTDGGLVVPVIRHAESLSLWGIARRIGELAESARAGTADRSELTGSTITITSLGALGGLVTTPVINKPETTIIGVNKMVVRPVWVDDQFVPRKMMNLSSSFDHRVIDGWDAARFVQALKRELEQPALLFVDRPERR